MQTPQVPKLGDCLFVDFVLHFTYKQKQQFTPIYLHRQSSSLWQQVLVLLSVQVLLSYLMIYLRLQVASLETRTKTVIDAHTCIFKFQSAFVA